jgi:hypothetical protein
VKEAAEASLKNGLATFAPVRLGYHLPVAEIRKVAPINRAYVLSSVKAELMPDSLADHRIRCLLDHAIGSLFGLFRAPGRTLKVEVHSRRPINADEAGMERNIRKYAFRTGRVFRPTEILAIPGYENSVSIEENLFQFPILPACLANPHHVRRFMVAAFAGHQCKVGAEALVDEELGH